MCVCPNIFCARPQIRLASQCSMFHNIRSPKKLEMWSERAPSGDCLDHGSSSVTDRRGRDRRADPIPAHPLAVLFAAVPS